MKGIKLKKNIILGILILIFSSCVISCGLDTFYYLDPPISYDTPLLLSNNDATQNFVSFITTENQYPEIPGFFKGTAVFYKIYANKTDVENDILKIDSCNTTSSYSSAYDQIIKLEYKELVTTNSTSTPLIKNMNRQRKIRIRLTDYNNLDESLPSDDFLPLIMYYERSGGQWVEDPSMRQIPRRCFNKYSFDFGREIKNIEFAHIPEDDDEDFKKGTVSDNMYYINLYAASVGLDIKSYYSSLLHLGTIKVDAGKEIN